MLANLRLRKTVNGKSFTELRELYEMKQTGFRNKMTYKKVILNKRQKLECVKLEYAIANSKHVFVIFSISQFSIKDLRRDETLVSYILHFRLFKYMKNRRCEPLTLSQSGQI